MDVIGVVDFDFLDKFRQGVVPSDFEILRNLFVIRCYHLVNVNIVDGCFNMFLEVDDSVICFVFDKSDRLKKIYVSEKK